MSPGLAERLVDASPVGLLVVDGAGRLIRTNPAGRAMLSLPPQAEGQDAAGLLPEGAHEALFGPLASRSAQRTVRCGERVLRLRAAPLGEPAEALHLLLVEDITAEHRAERHRAELVANVSHELRTPATAIAGYAETLLEDAARLDPAVQRMVEAIHRNARRLTELFDDLLYLSRIDAQEGPLPQSPVALAPVVAECLDKVQAAANEKELTVQTFGLESARVLAHREALGHVIGNLVENAVKYSHRGGVVTVGARRRDEGWRIEVIDVGIGIDPAHHERIFERFYRVDKGRARAAGGTGLGLAIVRRLCEKMGARLSLRSQLGSGSVFRVWLPEAPTE